MKSYIKDTTQTIINKAFSQPEKRRINEYHDRINFACPVCNDSTRHTHKKRGNIYFDTLLFLCFRCGAKMSFDKFCKEFHQQIDPTKKLEIIEHINSQISYHNYEDDIVETQFDKLLNMEDLERIFNNGEHVITDFKPIENGSKVSNYLMERKITPSLSKNIYQGKYWVNENRYEDIICFINRRGSKLLSIQVRNIKAGKYRMFKIYNYETLYKWIYDVEEIEDLDIKQIVLYNKLGYYFNIMNVDFEQPITIFEGYIDSLFYPNSIGVVGTNTDMKFLEGNNLELQYLYDNDKAGHIKAEEKIKSGYPVFLWNKLFKDIVDKKNTNDPYKLMERISTIKDLNQLSSLVDDPYKKLSLNRFFSSDIFDISYIPKYKKYFNYKK